MFKGTGHRQDLIDRAARAAQSAAKNDGVSPAQYRQAYGEGDNVKLTAACTRATGQAASNAMDFDDLLLKTLLLV